MAETVLISGGTGFIGSYLAASLVEEGHDVVTFDATPTTTHLDRLDVTDEVSIERGDVTDFSTLARTVHEAGVTRLVHLAAPLAGEATDRLAATRVYTVGANVMLEVARLFDEQIERVVLASSETVYGPGSKYDGPVTEDALVFPNSPYSAGKRYAEVLGQTYGQEYGLSVVSLRPTGVFGPGANRPVEFATLFEQPALGETCEVRGGKTTVSWLYVTDAADAFERAALAPPESLTHHIYNVRGDVTTVGAAAARASELFPGNATVTDKTDLDWSAQDLSLARSSADLGYEVTHDFESTLRAYGNAVRARAGLDPV